METIPTIIILGPTASGKTKLSVNLAKQISGEIISADSRQVYKGMDIGTGKDLEEYGNVPYHLIDILEAGERYEVNRFIKEAKKVETEIKARGNTPIVCGGTGLYIQGFIQGLPYSEVPKNLELRAQYDSFSLTELQKMLLNKEFPTNYKPDFSTHKRAIRALEIYNWLKNGNTLNLEPVEPKSYLVFGLDPDLNLRRDRITNRLYQRIEQGLREECLTLLDKGLKHDDLQYYGLEYKYCSDYIQGKLDKESFITKLNTEIHRFAKRQMTFFRKMEKDGIKINWIKMGSLEERTHYILNFISRNQHS